MLTRASQTATAAVYLCGAELRLLSRLLLLRTEPVLRTVAGWGGGAHTLVVRAMSFAARWQPVVLRKQIAMAVLAALPVLAEQSAVAAAAPLLAQLDALNAEVLEYRSRRASLGGGPMTPEGARLAALADRDPVRAAALASRDGPSRCCSRAAAVRIRGAERVGGRAHVRGGRPRSGVQPVRRRGHEDAFLKEVTNLTGIQPTSQSAKENKQNTRRPLEMRCGPARA